MKGACGAGAQGSIHFGPEWSAADGAAGAHETRVGYFALSTPDGKPKDTTGAGDSFLGAFAAAKSAGLSTLAAVRAAGVVAARSVQGRGAQPSYATAADLDLDALPAVEAPPSSSGLFTLREDSSIAGR